MCGRCGWCRHTAPCKRMEDVLNKRTARASQRPALTCVRCSSDYALKKVPTWRPTQCSLVRICVVTGLPTLRVPVTLTWVGCAATAGVQSRSTANNSHAAVIEAQVGRALPCREGRLAPMLALCTARCVIHDWQVSSCWVSGSHVQRVLVCSLWKVCIEWWSRPVLHVRQPQAVRTGPVTWGRKEGHGV